MSGFVLGQRSLDELIGVHPDLVRVVHHAIRITRQDFTVFDGLRTPAEQAEIKRRGASTTLNSKHLRQADGFSHAVDLVPWIAGRARWEWPAIYPIAAAVQQAAIAEGVRLRWGGTWTEINRIAPGAKALEAAQRAYVQARLAAGRRAFPDGPHYELIR